LGDLFWQVSGGKNWGEFLNFIPYKIISCHYFLFLIFNRSMLAYECKNAAII